MKKAIIAASFDPITNGHINIIDRALNTFDHVLVGIGINPQKKYTFDLKTREALTKKVLEPYGSRITVKSYAGLLADFAYENQIKTIIRGARNSADFDFEKMLSDINQGFKMGLDTYILVADQNLSHISSSAAKELQRSQAKNVLEYVPLVVKRALEREISGQCLIGVTGGIGCGKSYVTQRLLETHYNSVRDNQEANNPPFQMHCVDMDKIGRYILTESEEPIHNFIRQQILDHYGDKVVEQNKISVPKLLSIIFDEEDALNNRKVFEKIMEEPIFHILRRNLLGKKGVILINSALFVESGVCPFVNNYFLFVTCSEDVQIDRLKKRGYTDQQIKNRLSSQYTAEKKLDLIQKSIAEHSCGNILKFQNEYLSNIDLRILYSDISEIWNAGI